MPSIPLTPQEEQEILQTIGAQSIEDLFATIPPKIKENADFAIRLRDEQTLPNGLSEHELRQFFSSLASQNAHSPQYQHFLGGGVYDNIIPAVVDHLSSRGEFLTCYTPYQPEISQGTLQAIFEFQTMISRLTGMAVSNASMYDGPTAAAEGVLMAQRLSRSKDTPSFLMASSLHSDFRSVISTFLRYQVNSHAEIGWTPEGTLDLKQLKEQVELHSPLALVVGYPNYFGVVEPLDKIKEVLPESCLLIVSVADPSVLSQFECPGELNADIVVGEAHQLGTPMLFGGPHVGFFATRKKFTRQMPGRLVGETQDSRGQRCYTLTLATREQHIRREKATSNICTNQGLIALRTTMYLSCLGKEGFLNLGKTNLSLFQYLTKELANANILLKFPKAQHYREGIFEIPNLEHRYQKALAEKVIPGILLTRKYPIRAENFTNSLLICVHPKHSKSDIDKLVEILSND